MTTTSGRTIRSLTSGINNLASGEQKKEVSNCSGKRKHQEHRPGGKGGADFVPSASGLKPGRQTKRFWDKGGRLGVPLADVKPRGERAKQAPENPSTDVELASKKSTTRGGEKKSGPAQTRPPPKGSMSESRKGKKLTKKKQRGERNGGHIVVASAMS